MKKIKTVVELTDSKTGEVIKKGTELFYPDDKANLMISRSLCVEVKPKKEPKEENVEKKVD